MVEMFIHENGPFFGLQWAEKAVRLLGAACGAGGGKAVDQTRELLAFGIKVSLVCDEQTLGGGRIAAHGFIFFESHGLYDATDEAKAYK